MGLVLGLAVTVIAARLWIELGLPVSMCAWKNLSGLPCPLCGSTRAVAALSEFEVAAAFAYNPLVCAGCLGGLAWCLLGPGVRRVLLESAQIGLGRRPWLWLIGLALANWSYLLLKLRP
jgi:hypothetical protein